MTRKVSPGQIEMNQINSSLRECQKSHVPYPSYVFKVGERVKYGMWNYAEVLEVCDKGRYYKIFQKTANVAYGKYIGEKEEVRYHHWLELLPYTNPKEFDSIPRFVEEEDVFFRFGQRDISSLFGMVQSSGVDLNTDYQRGLVWTPDQEIDLIISIFKNIDIGKFTLIRRKFSEELNHYYEMLDGKQRLTALCRFFEGRFKYMGRTFQQLHPRDQNHFQGYPISYAECEPLTDEQKYRYFIKLNTTGQVIDPNHMEKVKKMLQNTRK